MKLKSTIILYFQAIAILWLLVFSLLNPLGGSHLRMAYASGIAQTDADAGTHLENIPPGAKVPFSTPTTATEFGTKGLVNCGKSPGDPCTLYHVFGLIARVTNFLLATAGFFAIFQIVRSGLSMILAAGNPEGITSAKNAMTNAVLGLALTLIAFVTMVAILALLGIDANPIEVITDPFKYIRR